jgi:hypothetical protein
LENWVENVVPCTAWRTIRSAVDPALGHRFPSGVSHAAHVPPGLGHVAVDVNAGLATVVWVGLKSMENPTFNVPVAQIFVSRNVFCCASW